MIRSLRLLLMTVGGMVSLPLHAAGADGLDLTMQVLGRDDTFDERAVNRIELPGVGLRGALAERTANAAEARQERREKLREAREERQERRQDALEARRERRESGR